MHSTTKYQVRKYQEHERLFVGLNGKMIVDGDEYEKRNVPI
jgi:hypothetical protein